MPNTREELIFLLSEAAELEHLMLCQYLYGAFSLKASPEEGLTYEQARHSKNWAQTLFLIAREEMSHLGIVWNILSAIGTAPHLQRPNFPTLKTYYPFPMELLPFSATFLQRMICRERPATITPQDSFCVTGLAAPIEDPVLLSAHPIPFQTVGELYEAIIDRIQKFDDGELFIGPPEAQTTSQEMQLELPVNTTLNPGVFDVQPLKVTDRASAIKAVQAIIEQGEGAPNETETSHFERLMKIYQDYQDLQPFEAARNIVPNPALFSNPETPGAHLITCPATREVLDVFCSLYELLLLLLSRFYAKTNESESDLNALRYTLYPMMTMVIRPLAEVLTTMPANSETLELFAGPSFEVFRTVHFLPHRHAAWTIFEERLNDAACRCQELVKAEGMPERLRYIAESMSYLSGTFHELANAPDPVTEP